MYGNPEVTSGGNALKYYASVRIDVRIKEKLTDASVGTGIKVKAKIVKNKVLVARGARNLQPSLAATNMQLHINRSDVHNGVHQPLWNLQPCPAVNNM